MQPKTIEDTAKFAEMVAAKQGWVVNQDTEFTDTLLEGLTTNWNRYGYFLCPCRDTEGSREADASVVCPCKYSFGDIDKYGHCFCALYLRKAFAASGKTPDAIPDRRYD